MSDPIDYLVPGGMTYPGDLSEQIRQEKRVSEYLEKMEEFILRYVQTRAHGFRAGFEQEDGWHAVKDGKAIYKMIEREIHAEHQDQIRKQTEQKAEFQRTMAQVMEQRVHPPNRYDLDQAFLDGLHKYTATVKKRGL